MPKEQHVSIKDCIKKLGPHYWLICPSLICEEDDLSKTCRTWFEKTVEQGVGGSEKYREAWSLGTLFMNLFLESRIGQREFRWGPLALSPRRVPMFSATTVNWDALPPNFFGDGAVVLFAVLWKFCIIGLKFFWKGRFCFLLFFMIVCYNNEAVLLGKYLWIFSFENGRQMVSFYKYRKIIE